LGVRTAIGSLLRAPFVLAALWAGMGSEASAQVLAWSRISEGAISSPFVKVPYAAGLETQSTLDVDSQGNTVVVVPSRQAFGLDLYESPSLL